MASVHEWYGISQTNLIEVRLQKIIIEKYVLASPWLPEISHYVSFDSSNFHNKIQFV